jgi:plasmid stabilization system protein ParE
MAVRLVVEPKVEWDISDAYAWYEEQRVGLGEDFLSRLDACIQKILRFPGSYPVVHEQYRRALLRKFPYAVFYEFTDDTVTVYAVFHTSRDPEKWKRRLP